jgi:hypothetical protein
MRCRVVRGLLRIVIRYLSCGLSQALIGVHYQSVSVLLVVGSYHRCTATLVRIFLVESFLCYRLRMIWLKRFWALMGEL